VVEAAGPADKVEGVVKALKENSGKDVPRTGSPESGSDRRVGFEDPAAYRAAIDKTDPVAGVTLYPHDYLWELVRDWPRGRGELALVVDRNGQSVPVAFTPRTVPFFPTQLYETVSMLLLIGVLLAFQPFRRHDGQVLVLLMVGYAAHRFLNEAIRIEPTYALGLTLSQWISVLIFVAAVGLELYLRRTQPRLPAGELPLSYGNPEPAPLPTAKPG
jgi:hypothetical protein